MHITVVPASTKTGYAIIRALLDDEAKPTVRGVYRDLAKVPSQLTAHDRFHAVKGDVSDAKSLNFTASDAVVAITPPRYDGADIVEHARQVSENTKQAIQAAPFVRRLVLLSSQGAQFDHDVGEIKTNNMAEQTLADAAPEVVFIRCAYFMSNWAMSLRTLKNDSPFFFSTITPLDFKFPMIAMDDIGHVCAREALAAGKRPPDRPHIIDLEGPASYSPLDVQAAFETVIGKEIEVRAVEKEGLPEFFGKIFPPSIVDEFVEMSTSFLPGGIMAADEMEPGKNLVRGKVELKEALEQIWNDQ